MARVILAALLGGILLFCWGALVWVIAPQRFEFAESKPMVSEAAVTQVLAANLPETGVYWFPNQPVLTTSEMQVRAAAEDWTAKHTEGPLGYVVYRADGYDPNDPMPLVKGIAIDFFAVMVAAMLLSCVSGGYGKRVMFMLGLGVFASVYVHLVQWNFMYNPTDFTLYKIGDAVGGWFVTGLLVAAIVKKPA
jgi:hypothetical protein